ncbi:MlaE family ABC transporter permease [Synechococcus sp. BDU 130192]|uniref:MlaE family ABC transporter permease n=1 Tax=Synechococcus sp. BDU 130192 TaxID=2042059 RepID=UPI000C06C4A4|nr:ABC transporter permease [Synechococcus sp. BDU 130192]
MEPIEEKRDPSLWYRLYCAGLMLGQVLWRLLRGKLRRDQITEQMLTAGPKALVPVLLVAFFGGMIFTIQTARELTTFGAESFVGGAFAIAFCRELAPILTASIIAGQVGSAFAAELGSMKITEQIDALYMLRSNPVDYLVMPRVVACCLMLPILTVFALVVGVIGGTGAAYQFYDLAPINFLTSVQTFLQPRDLINVGVKGILFGLLVGIIGCSWGLTTIGSTQQVGRSATSAVVTTWIGIFMLDFFLSLLLFHQSPLG